MNAAFRLNLCAGAGIVSMAVGAWILCGAGFALAVFGGFTWITTLIAAQLTIVSRKGGE